MKTTNERFDEKFPLQQLHDYHELTGHIARKGEIAEFIQSEISLAKEEGKKEGREEERKRIVEMIEERQSLFNFAPEINGYKYIKSKDLGIITLITNNK